MFNKLFKSATETVSDFAKDPIGTTVNTVTQPVRDALDVVDGLTEGELRIAAAARLGGDVAGDMALSELIEWYDAR